MRREVGERVFVSPGEGASPNAGLIVGDTACLVVDTRMTHPQGRAIAEAARHVTALPWEMMRRDGPVKRACFAGRAEPPLAGELAAAEIVPPDRTFATEAVLDLGGRTVHLRHLGRGNTDMDHEGSTSSLA